MAQLLTTKLQPQRLRPDRVPRPHLYDHLADFESGVVVVSAPPGFGKSTMVVEWLMAQQRPFAWYSLDRYDNEVGLFAEYLNSAVGKLVGGEGGTFSVPGERTPDIRAMVAALAGDLLRSPRGSVLVLDDYQEIDSSDVHDAVNYLIDNVPDGLVITIVTRADPPIPLARLRANGRLLDIRGNELRFTTADVSSYFKRTAGIDIDTAEAETISHRSEGWVSALQLISLGSDAAPDPRLADMLSAGHPHIAGYLFEEVLRRLPPELTDFMIATATFDRFDAGLCRELTSEEDPHSMIEEIEKANAFLVPLGDGWYRYHHLFAELLRARLRRLDPVRQQALLVRAAHVCDARSLPDDSIEYALRADDLALAGAVLDRHTEAAVGTGEIARLRSWLTSFPVPAGPASHVVALGWAWCRIFEGDQRAANECLDQVEREHLDAFDVDPRPQLEIMRAMVAFQEGDPERAQNHAVDGLATLVESSVYLRCLGHLYLGRALYSRASTADAVEHLQRAAALADGGNHLAAVNALFWVGAVACDTGSLMAAEATMVRAQEIASQVVAGSSDTGTNPVSGFADIGLAFMKLYQLDWEDAIRLAERGSALLERATSIDMMLRGFFARAEGRSLAGDHEEADAVVDEGLHWFRGRDIGSGPPVSWLWLAKTRNLWRQGRLADAGETLDRVLEGGLGGFYDPAAFGFWEAASRLSHAVRLGDLQQAQGLLGDLPLGTEGNVLFAIERNVLTCAVREMAGDTHGAAASLEAAVGLAFEGYRYPFSHVGPVIKPTLRRIAGRTKHDDFVRSLLERLPAEVDQSPQQPADPLTDRELDVMAEIAAGYTNDEIADRLFISRATVKRHVSNVYLKLGVHHRAEAVARARELNLIR